MILEKLEYCPLCEADYATQYEYDFQICNNCDPIPTIEEIEDSSYSTAQVAAMAARIAELEAELSTLKAQDEARIAHLESLCREVVEAADMSDEHGLAMLEDLSNAIDKLR